MNRAQRRALKLAPEPDFGPNVKMSTATYYEQSSDLFAVCDLCDRGGMVLRGAEDGGKVEVFFPPDMWCEHVQRGAGGAFELWMAFAARRLKGQPQPITFTGAGVQFSVVTVRWLDGQAS
jgi:hypothetical protein